MPDRRGAGDRLEGRGRADPDVRTEPQISAGLAVRGKAAGFACWAVVADCAYSVSDDWYPALRDADLPYVVALKPHCAAPGHLPTSRTPPSTPPRPWPGRTPSTPATGRRSSDGSA
ncbi:transposase [Streptomyces roseirectus]|uniref:Transposase n=1 Tax=Streptomyces roseirectus TaxID=2768066 RepID=A0A7H0ITS1_9ACTN|nr:transposase [Streptomyces roseirectus]